MALNLLQQYLSDDEDEGDQSHESREQQSEHPTRTINNLEDLVILLREHSTAYQVQTALLSGDIQLPRPYSIAQVVSIVKEKEDAMPHGQKYQPPKPLDNIENLLEFLREYEYEKTGRRPQGREEYQPSRPIRNLEDLIDMLHEHEVVQDAERDNDINAHTSKGIETLDDLMRMGEEEEKRNKQQGERRSPRPRSHSASSSSSSCTFSSDDDQDDEPVLWNEEEENACGGEPGKKPPIRAIGELGMDQLPPIEELTISVPQQMCVHIGTLSNVVDTLVIVESLADQPALDIDTVLFLERGQRPLGKIFDVFGQVNQPFYCVRFNSQDHIKDKQVAIGSPVYCAPQTQHTRVVCLPLLMNIRGSDASWKNDLEPPDKYLDYSDDEEERKARKNKKNKQASGSELTDFEKKMNERNLQKTAECREKRNYYLRNNPRIPNRTNPANNGNYSQLGNSPRPMAAYRRTFLSPSGGSTFLRPPRLIPPPPGFPPMPMGTVPNMWFSQFPPQPPF